LPATPNPSTAVARCAPGFRGINGPSPRRRGSPPVIPRPGTAHAPPALHRRRRQSPVWMGDCLYEQARRLAAKLESRPNSPCVALACARGPFPTAHTHPARPRARARPERVGHPTRLGRCSLFEFARGHSTSDHPTLAFASTPLSCIAAFRDGLGTAAGCEPLDALRMHTQAGTLQTTESGTVGSRSLDREASICADGAGRIGGCAASHLAPGQYTGDPASLRPSAARQGTPLKSHSVAMQPPPLMRVSAARRRFLQLQRRLRQQRIAQVRCVY
jgi:hypothetical protein